MGPTVADVRRLPGPLSDRWDWQIHSACRGLDSTVFFHPDHERGAERATRDATAKTLCHTCPVVDQCRTHALEAQEPYGIWGGLTAQDRHDILHPTLDATTAPPTPPTTAVATPVATSLPLAPLAPLFVDSPGVGGVVAEPGGGARP